MNILAICGSLRADSSNMSILTAIENWLPKGINYHIYDNIGVLPHFDPACNLQNTPKTVINFRELIAEADGVIICSPEYIFGIPGSLKNALDWTAGSGEFNEKPVAIITASSSGQKAHEALIIVMSVLTSFIPHTSSLLIPYTRTKVNTAGEITDNKTVAQLQNVVKSLLDQVAGKLPN